MVVRLRLARHGTKNNPFYHVVAIRDKASRDAKPIEKLGEYDPIPRPPSAAIATRPSSIASTSSQRVLSSGINDGKVQMEKRIEWNAERIQYWLSEGAQPSKPVARLLDKVSGCL
jgi:small subunit ribosomal protein S16